MKTTEVITTTKWNIDPAHSEIQFKARHLLITTVTGEFKNYEATVETQGDDFTTANITFTAVFWEKVSKVESRLVFVIRPS